MNCLPWRKPRGKMVPATICLHHVHNCLQDQPSVVDYRMSRALTCNQQLRKSTPYRFNYFRLNHFRCPAFHFYRLQPDCCWSLRYRRVPSSASIVGELCAGLMASSPPRPVQDCRAPAFHCQNEQPEKAAYFGATQAEFRPRRTLNIAKLPVTLRVTSPFFGTTLLPRSARTTVKKACAHIVSVM